MLGNVRCGSRGITPVCPASPVVRRATFLLLIVGVLVWPILGGLRAQEEKSAPPPAPRPAPAAPTTAPPPAVEQPTPLQFQPQAFVIPPAKRFQFKIAPDTPLKDLLPVPPKTHKADPVLVDDLAQVPEVEFQAPLARQLSNEEMTKETAHTIARINHVNTQKPDAFMDALRGDRLDLNGLPFAMGDACRTKGERSRQFALAVATVRASLQQRFIIEPAPIQATPSASSVSTPSTSNAPPPVPVQFATRQVVTVGEEREASEVFWDRYQTACAQEDKKIAKVDRAQREHVTAARVAALMQVLAPEAPSLRLGLVKHLSATAHVDATKALARLAIFTVEDEVRPAAVHALKVRREQDYTDILLSGLRYPLPSVARHAADALVKLERTDLVPQLVDALDGPDPRAPISQEVDQKKVSVVRELVRINHHRNCLLCHAPGNTGTVSSETLTAAVPIPGEPLPSPFDGYRASSPDVLVRIDVTYLRQDFSAYQVVEDANPWPEMQRFDFLVRTRMLTEEEAAAYQEKCTKREPGKLSPYHRAALAALRELTGKDTEPTAAAWRRLLAQNHQKP